MIKSQISTMLEAGSQTVFEKTLNVNDWCAWGSAKEVIC